MTEDKLQHLKGLAAPPARAEARERALAAAMAAFDAAASDADLAARGSAAAVEVSPIVGLPPTPNPSPRGGGESAAEKISATTPKDASGADRLKLTNNPIVRRPRMQLTRFQYGMAASIAALVVAAPIAMHVMRDAQPRPLAPEGWSPPAEAPRGAASKPRGLDETVAKPASPASVATAPTSSGVPATHDTQRIAGRDAPTIEALRREAAQKQAADAQRREDSKAKAEAGAKPTADVGAVVKTEADKDAKVGNRLPHAAERAAELEATTARKGNRKTEAGGETPQGTVRLDSGRGQEPTAVASPSVTVAAAPPPPAAASPSVAVAPPSAMAPAKPAVPPRAQFMGGAAPSSAAPSRNLVVPDQSGAASRSRHVGEAKIADGHPVGDVLAGQAGGKLHSAPHDQRTATYMPPRPEPAPHQVEENRDQFQGAPDNPVKQVAQEPVSTFSIDVDTASYSFARRALNGGRLPPKDAVRVEEMINYFPYDYTGPETADVPFQPNISVFPAPWNSAHQLVHIGLKGYELKSTERPRANIVLLIDTSGSMAPEDRLPLLKNAFRMLVDELKPDDTVSIVTYAGDTRVALEPTRVADKGRILSAIASLNAGGGTYGEGGIKKAYELAEASFDAKGVNRIVLGTDGDFNIGITNRDELKGYIERKRDKGIYLSIVGVGRGNYNDATMQALAQNGNGAAAYVDTLSEAHKVLVDEASSTLFPIAKDVKIQVEFNPAVVSEYRLIGYETRLLKREDFNNDKVDAGDVGSGHTVTAIYEVTPVTAPPSVDPLRYGGTAASEPQRRVGADTGPREAVAAGELGFFKLRYKLPKEDTSRLLTLAIGPQQTKATIAEAPAEARFSAAVAAFGQLLRGAPYLGSFGYDDVTALAQGARGEDRFGYRAEFLNLVRLAKSAAR